VTRRDEWGRPGPVKVLLADDQALVRAGFKVLPQGLRPGRAAARHPGGRGRGGAAGAQGHPPADRPVRRHPHRPPGRPGAAGRADQREREILALVGRGLSNQEIATELTVSKATARTHVSRVIGKLGVRDRAQLVVVAYQTGLVSSGPPPA
jgi:DNA-binding CsgD family transcriptional regulator